MGSDLLPERSFLPLRTFLLRLFILKQQKMAKSKKQIIQNVNRHRQNLVAMKYEQV